MSIWEQQEAVRMRLPVFVFEKTLGECVGTESVRMLPPVFTRREALVMWEQTGVVRMGPLVSICREALGGYLGCQNGATCVYLKIIYYYYYLQGSLT